MTDEKTVVKPKVTPRLKAEIVLGKFLDKEGIVLVPQLQYVSTNHNTFETQVTIGVSYKK